MRLKVHGDQQVGGPCSAWHHDGEITSPDLLAQGVSLSMDTPSPGSMPDLMTCLMQDCEVVHRLDGLMLSNQDHLSVATIGIGVW